MDSPIAPALNRAEQLCKLRGVRLTPQRRAVLALLLASDKPLGAYEILEQMREQIDKPAPPMVYRALDFLLEQGFAHKLESLHAYIGCNHPDHPHVSQFLICTQCGLVDELDNSAISQGINQAEEQRGFRTQKPVIELLGTCARCTSSN